MSAGVFVARIMVTLIIICYDDSNDKRKRIYSVSALGREQEIVGNEISDALSDIFYDGFSDVILVRMQVKR